MRKLTFLLFVFFISGIVMAQQSTTDSIAKVKKDSIENAKYWAKKDAELQHFRDSVKESQKNNIEGISYIKHAIIGHLLN